MKCNPSSRGGMSRCLKFTVLAVAGIALLTWVVMALWNCLMPDLFHGVAQISYWQALGLLALCRILFGGLRGCCSRRCHGHHGEGAALSDAERDHIKARFGRRWLDCCGTSPADRTDQH